MKPIRVLLVDDHDLVRAGIRSLLQNMEGIEVVAEAGDGRDAVRLTKMHHPDIVLIDIATPGLNGLEVTARLAKEFPRVRVIILSMYANEEYMLQALRAGAAGYLIKGANTPDLEIAIKAVTRGETYLSPGVSKHIVRNYVQQLGSEVSPPELLTPRQREILQLIAERRSTKRIASMLNLSVKTVETHRKQLMERLDIHNIPRLVRYAIRVGMVKP
jgi:DNA-binding NarL/FixJ family response regulator